MKLYIANKNYSSWSLRPWVLMRTLGIEFEEILKPFPMGGGASGFGSFSPTARVPVFLEQGLTVWDSLAITEYLAEKHPQVWPTDSTARAWARSATAEMHSGFAALRTGCPMSCGVRMELNPPLPEGLLNDLQRLQALWEEGLQGFGGPFLAGRAFSAVDAFFLPRGVSRADLWPRAVNRVHGLCANLACVACHAGLVQQCLARALVGALA